MQIPVFIAMLLILMVIVVEVVNLIQHAIKLGISTHHLLENVYIVLKLMEQIVVIFLLEVNVHQINGSMLHSQIA